MTPSSQLATAVEATAGLDYEVKPRGDGAYWHRFRCRTCGRIGTWLAQPEQVRANANAHAQSQHGVREC